MKRSNSTQIDKKMLISIFSNFPEMEYLNQVFNDQYSDITDSQHDLVYMLSIASMILFLLLSLLLSILLDRYLRFRFHQLALSFNFLTFIPGHYFEKMRDYYALLLSTIGEKDKLKEIDNN